MFLQNLTFFKFNSLVSFIVLKAKKDLKTSLYVQFKYLDTPFPFLRLGDPLFRVLLILYIPLIYKLWCKGTLVCRRPELVHKRFKKSSHLWLQRDEIDWSVYLQTWLRHKQVCSDDKKLIDWKTIKIFYGNPFEDKRLSPFSLPFSLVRILNLSQKALEAKTRPCK